MQAAAEAKKQERRIPSVIESDEDLELFRQHLKEIIEGTAFRGSQRSAQFLAYVVEQAIAGQCNTLKERTIGVELFGRSPTYDTGEDAIVRVTASDVRRRLLQHYGRFGAASEFRISLPPGHYVPEIVRESRPPAAAPPLETVSPHSRATDADTEIAPASPAAKSLRSPTWRPFLALVVVLCAVNLLAWLIVYRHRNQSEPNPAVAVLPWTVLLHNSRPTMLVSSDPNIGEIQRLTDEPVSISDYANQIYIPPRNSLSPELLHFAHDVLRGDKAANVDVGVVANVAELAQRTGGGRLAIRAARNLRLDELDTENNFIFIGSPLTDPWTRLFDDHLDFRFVYDKAAHTEFIVNAHPRVGEAATYVPTAKGFATGQSFATVSFIGNPNHSGQVLMLAGLNAEGTKVTGELATHLADLSGVLSRCGIDPKEQLQHFQLLLRLSMMAGSPTRWDVLACHPLP
jgi:hypothetical protein